MNVSLVLFFFSSRRRHTRWTGDWSSDVCSSDLALVFLQQPTNAAGGTALSPGVTVAVEDVFGNTVTSDTSAVTLKIGRASCREKCRSRWWAKHEKKNNHSRTQYESSNHVGWTLI